MIIPTTLQGQHYAILTEFPTSLMTPDSHEKTEYAEIQQQPNKPTSSDYLDQDTTSNVHTSSTGNLRFVIKSVMCSNNYSMFLLGPWHPVKWLSTSLTVGDSDSILKFNNHS